MMAGLSQGVLADNSVSPDVEIQKFQKDSVRSQLKHAISITSKPAHTPLAKNIQRRSKIVECTQPCLIEKQKSDNLLAFEVAKLSNKLDNFEKQARIADQKEIDERTLDLEKKITKITDERLQYLEKLQHEQEQWKSQYFETIRKLNSLQSGSQTVSKPTYSHVSYPPCVNTKQNILETPLPRKTVPQPARSGQIGNGQFLRDILDQSAIASTPDITHQHQVGPVDTIPVRLVEEQQSLNHNVNGTSAPLLSPIKPRTSQIIAKEIENEAERKQISEKFPNSITDYLPNESTTPVTHVLSKSIPPSSLVAEFRSKLRKLIEMRSNLENNLQAVQKKPKLFDYATAALVNQLQEDGLLSAGDEKLCWIKKLVDEEINLHMHKIKQEVAQEVSASKKKPLKIGRPSRFSRRTESKKAEAPEKQITKSKKKSTRSKPLLKQPDLENANESFVTHVYGKADYHPHRTTVHKPFMHVVSPLKSPKYRTKRALQALEATYVRSEKTQTKAKTDSPTLLKSKYLAQTAVSLKPPQVFENEPDPVIVPAAQPMAIFPKSTPQKSPLVKRVEIIEEGLPGNDTMFSTDSDDTVAEEQKLEVSGEGCCRKLYPKPCTPPPQKKLPSCKSPVQADTDVCPLEKMKCWVEQEIMSRILNQLYPASATQQTQTLNLEMDTMKKLVEDEIQAQIRHRLLQQNKVKPVQPEPVCPVHTPIPTPQPTPSSSISEESVSQHYLMTAPVSTETSTAETEEVELSVRIPSPEVSVSQEVAEVSLVSTPKETPVPSPEISSKEESIKSSVPDLSITDPWEGRMPEDDLQHGRSFVKCHPKLAPEPEPTDLVVRSITPPLPPQKSISLSESSSSESLITEDKTISEGQLVIEHGEMRLKKRKPLQVPENYEDLLHQNTLGDVADIEPISEGEFRPNTRPPIIQTRYADLITDDPSGIYIRPRRPGIASDTEDLSVGEVPDKKRSKFNKWKAAKQSTSPQQTKAKEEFPLSIGDLQSTSFESSSISEELAPNVIKVTSATPRSAERFGQQNIPEGTVELTKSDQIIRDSLDDPQVKPRNQMTLTIPTTDPLSGASDTEEISLQDF